MVRHRWELRTRATGPGAPRSRVRLGAGRAATLCVLFAALAWISASLLFHPPARAGEELGRIELERADQGQAKESQTKESQAAPGAEGSATGAPGNSPTHGGAVGTPAEADPHGDGPARTSAAVVVVHVAGAVKRPGVYELPAGTRAHEAVDAAGGPTGKADPGAVNLASPVADGQRLYIPERGESVPPASGGGGGMGAGGGTGTEATSGTVNVNTATSEDLQRLPGIGPALAERIIDFRERNGPFGSLAELDAVSGIGPGVLARLDGMVSFT